jgi:hypothetical protein
MNKIYIYIARAIFTLLRIFNIKRAFITKIHFNLGLNNIMILSQKFDKIKYISETECKVYSQNGEDGIINYLINKLEIYKPNFIEIGVGSYIEANTRFLYERFYPKGLIIDCEKNLKEKVGSNVNLWKGDLRIVEAFVNVENIQSLISKNCDFEVDIFSLDIDGIDYWILDEIKDIHPKIIIAEYNPIFGSKLEITVPNISNFNRKEYHYSQLCYGMSLVSLIKTMKRKNYYYVGSNSACNNAFFISNNFIKDKYFKNLIIKDLSYYVNSNIRESRNENGKLNFLTGKKRIQQIKDCKVIDLSDEKKVIVSIENLVNKYSINLN